MQVDVTLTVRVSAANLGDATNKVQNALGRGAPGEPTVLAFLKVEETKRTWKASK